MFFDNKFKEFFSDSSKVKLGQIKKSAIKQELFSFMKDNPILLKPQLSFGDIFRFKKSFTVASLLVLFLFIGSTVVTKADLSLPGELLYPIKIGFNERVMEILVFSDTERIDLNVKLANLRLVEAEKLIIQGKLDNNTVNKINDNFKEKAEKVSMTLKKISDSQPIAENKAADFESSLKAHEQIFDDLGKDDAEQNKKFIDDLKNASSKISDIRKNLKQSFVDIEDMENSIKEKVAEQKSKLGLSFESKKVLDLSNKGLTSIPGDVFLQTDLEELDVSDNNIIGAIQSEIRQLKNLKVLDASNNQMTGVPAEIGQLKDLNVLDLSDNQLTGLPFELGNLKNLKTLNLSGNSYFEQDLNIIKSKLPSSVNIITQQ